jgi:hypothetical protein
VPFNTVLNSAEPSATLPESSRTTVAVKHNPQHVPHRHKQRQDTELSTVAQYTLVHSQKGPVANGSLKHSYLHIGGGASCKARNCQLSGQRKVPNRVDNMHTAVSACMPRCRNRKLHGHASFTLELRHVHQSVKTLRGSPQKVPPHLRPICEGS